MNIKDVETSDSRFGMVTRSLAPFSLALAILLQGYVQAQSIGIGGGPPGGEVEAIAIDLTNAATLYVGTSDSGIFKTTDGGMNWASASVGLTRSWVTEIAIDPSDSSVIYAGTDEGIFKSTNRAGSWVQVGPDRNPLVYDLLIAGSSSSRVYASTTRGCFKSTDGGATWKRIESAQQWTGVSPLAVDPSDPDTLYAHIGRSSDVIVRDGWSAPGIYRTTDDGKSWTRMFAGIDTSDAVKLVFAREKPHFIYIVTSRRLFKSADGGQSWETVAEGFTNRGSISDFIVSPSNPDVLYVGVAEPFIRTRGAVFKSVDGGKIWSSVTTGFFNSAVNRVVIDFADPSTLYSASRTDGVNKSTNGGTSWKAINSGLTAHKITQLTVDSASGTIFASTAGGVFKSTNGGVNWVALGPRGVGGWVTALAINPKNPREIFVGIRDRGLYRSLDGGENWDELKSVLLPRAVYPPDGIHSLAMDPSSPAVLYAGTSNGVYKTDDEGALWYPATPNFRDIDAVAINPTNSQIVYAAAEGRGVFRSDDGGETWSFANEGLPSPRAARASALLIDPTDGKTVYAVMQELYVSRDEGRSWLPLTTNLATHRVSTLAIDFSNRTLFVGTDGNGVFKSTDSGETWTNISTGLTNLHVWTLIIDPRQHSTLYVGTDGNGVFKSADAGLTWQPTSSK